MFFLYYIQRNMLQWVKSNQFITESKLRFLPHLNEFPVYVFLKHWVHKNWVAVWRKQMKQHPETFNTPTFRVNQLKETYFKFFLCKNYCLFTVRQLYNLNKMVVWSQRGKEKERKNILNTLTSVRNLKNKSNTHNTTFTKSFWNTCKIKIIQY